MFSEPYAYTIRGMFPNRSTTPSVAIADDIQIIEKLANRKKAKTYYEWEDDKKGKKKIPCKVSQSIIKPLYLNI